MRTIVLSFLLVLTALAGCLSNSDSGDTNFDDPDAIGGNGSNVGQNSEFEMPIHLLELEPEHNHSDPTQHDIVNDMTQEGFVSFGEDLPAGWYVSEIDVANDLMYIGIMTFGFIVVDVSDPHNPTIVTKYDMRDETADDESTLGVYLADIKTDVTGEWVFVALELSTTPGVFIYDMRDPTNPILAGFWPNPGQLLGCHMIEYAVVDNQEYLFCVPLDDAMYVGLISDPTATGQRAIATVNRWVPASEAYAAREAEGASGTPGSTGYHSVGGHHDMTWQKDPLTGADVLSVSLWNLGWFWLDVTTPAAPEMLGEWYGESSPDWGGQMHTAMMFESEGRRIAVGIPEVAIPPVVQILDVTDYANPIVLSHWNAVEEWHGEEGRFSTHNFQVVEGKVYVTHYHGGLFVLDISTPELQSVPEIAGTYMPMDRTPENYGAGCCGGSWDVVVWEGYAYTANNGGLFVAHLNGEPINDEYSGFA
jgi:hypothetical protein